MRIYAYIIIVVAIIYIYSYYLFPKVVSVLQTSADRFSTNMLLDKQPVVVEESFEFFDTQMSSWYLHKDITSSYDIDTWHKNKFKYLGFYSVFPCELMACPGLTPPNESSSIIAFKMLPGQTVFLPFHWSYSVIPKTDTTVPLKVVGVHDLVTFFLP